MKEALVFSYRKGYVNKAKGPNETIAVIVAIAWVTLDIMDSILNQESLADH